MMRDCVIGIAACKMLFHRRCAQRLGAAAVRGVRDDRDAHMAALGPNAAVQRLWPAPEEEPEAAAAA